MWTQIAALVVSLIISYLFRPKAQGPARPTLDDINAPSAKEGQKLQILFGTRTIENLNCTAFPGIRTKAIKKSGGKK